ncbi:hypothetical protein Corgl_0395 [Coriobacterium glomerans PW2]|uniref:DUF4352 domain-containing protein n=1 Tax=Coriobacterium glomerans (strain ATCC 49209 / DSM 20642 / JCM 10262 / PW2) TaxID=700015 RepID=F2NAI6_CORGP|nr:hypothetical protein [Coriobacterium glomerans]AEB06513.1 hypothetical protein Corgl_0395 [Coriobacterium glomerans PW2]
MALARREARFIKFIIATAVVIAIVAAGWLGYRHLQDQKTEREKQAFNTVYDPGQTAELDAAKDESCVLPSSKEPYAAGLGFVWTGTLEVAVENAEIYDSFKASGLAASHAGDSFRSDKQHPFLVCKVHIKNKNAVPQDESSRTKQKCFNISFLNLMPAGEVAYFDGTMEGASEQERWDFKLAPGAEQTYTVGFALEGSRSIQLKDIRLTAAISPDAYGKYSFTLNITDHRTKERA